jgi:hypothetical protein
VLLCRPKLIGAASQYLVFDSKTLALGSLRSFENSKPKVAPVAKICDES